MRGLQQNRNVSGLDQAPKLTSPQRRERAERPSGPKRYRCRTQYSFARPVKEKLDLDSKPNCAIVRCRCAISAATGWLSFFVQIETGTSRSRPINRSHNRQEVTVMKFTSSLAIAGMVALLGASAAMAQMTPAKPAAPAAPAAATKPAPAPATDKMAVSKECSDQANAKNLHGKERRKFREQCKHNGGKAM
jgi:hypothetical protein